MVTRIILFSLLLCGALLNALAEKVLPVGTTSFAAALASPQSQNRNAIRGRITDTNNRPLDRVRVELQDEVEMFIKQVYTDSMGRYSFTSLSAGTFIIKVHSNGTHVSSNARITLMPTRGPSRNPQQDAGSSHQEIYDFTLPSLLEARKTSVPNNSGVAFVQEVPEPARKLYEKALPLLEQKKTEEGVETLKQALKIFTTYFQAWERLGIEYVKLEHYEAAQLALSQAVKVNANAADSYYGLGYTHYQLGHWHDSSESLTQSLRLAPDSPNAAFAHYYLGLALLKQNLPQPAEQHLKLASTLGHNNIPTDVHLRLAQLYSNTKHYKEAASELEIYLKRAPNAQDAPHIRDLIKQLRSKEKAATVPASKLLSSTEFRR